MRIKVILLILCIFCMNHQQIVVAQEMREDEIIEDDSLATNSFWDNWYAQFGADMNLLFPEGHNMKDVFPNGKSFGVNFSIGKWFSPEFGGRFKITWNNGLLKNEHNTWLSPYGKAGENHRQGGFLTFIWDVQLDVHNLFSDYRPERKWNLIVSPRAGGWLDIGSGKGCPLLGVGVINTYRLNTKWRIFAEAGYHFVASINGVFSGTGHGSNGFLEFGAGVEMDLSKENLFHKESQKRHNDKSYVINTFWENWFAQMGLGMSLQNPYSTNFKYVFPNGNTLGLNFGLGKWFTPEVGVRGGLNWQNGLIVNHHADWLKPREDSEGDENKHSYISLYADMFFNLQNIISGYEKSRKWNTIIFPRMGLARNFAAEYKECPILGIGIEQTYRFKKNWRLYADVAYQVTTRGFHDKKFNTGHNSLNSNGWFDINVGVQLDLGKNTWRKVR